MRTSSRRGKRLDAERSRRPPLPSLCEDLNGGVDEHTLSALVLPCIAHLASRIRARPEQLTYIA